MHKILELAIGYLVVGFLWMTLVKGLDTRASQLKQTRSVKSIIVLTWQITLFSAIIKFIKQLIQK